MNPGDHIRTTCGKKIHIIKYVMNQYKWLTTNCGLVDLRNPTYFRPTTDPVTCLKCLALEERK